MYSIFICFAMFDGILRLVIFISVPTPQPDVQGTFKLLFTVNDSRLFSTVRVDFWRVYLH